jgi:CubicO group peptidase (beta-lactamase class C family)
MRLGTRERGGVVGFSPRRFVTGALLAPFLVVACGSDAAGPDARYPEAAAHGMDAGALERAFSEARDIEGIRTLLVQREGVLIAEEYFHGSRPDSLYQVWSVTKSIVSVLTGIALDRGDLTGLDQTLAEYLAPIVDSIPDDKGRITVRDLLTMTCGLEWHELDGGDQYSTWIHSPDMIQYVIDLPWVSPPGRTFHYHTGCTHLLAVLVAEATGTPLLDFAREHLFGPVGIEESDWWTDEREYYTGGMGLYLRPADMVKLGELMLREGVWNGAPVIPADWVRASTAAQVSTGNAVPFGPEYGYLWWVGHDDGRDFYFANGYAGQFILVVPELDLVATATSTWRGMTWNEAGAQWSAVISVIVDGVLPAAH